MPKMSKTNAQRIEEQPPFTERTSELEGYTVNIVTLNVDMDLAPLLKGLPDDRCQCPHWGYQIAGTQTVTYADHEETYEAGDVWYMSPGHSPRATAGSEFIVFSPTKELQPSLEVMGRNAQALAH